MWTGHERSKPNESLRAYDFGPIDYKGLPHLKCSKVDGPDFLHLQYTTNVVLNSSYAVVSEFGETSESVRIDPHEFMIARNSTKIVQAASRSTWWPRDNILPAQEKRPIVEVVIQILDAETRAMEFQWHLLDHVLPSTTPSRLV